MLDHLRRIGLTTLGVYVNGILASALVIPGEMIVSWGSATNWSKLAGGSDSEITNNFESGAHNTARKEATPWQGCPA